MTTQPRTWLWIIVLGGPLVALGTSYLYTLYTTQQQALEALPAGLGKDEFIAHCTPCHGVEKIVTAKPRHRQAWEQTIVWMQKMQGMAPLEADTRARILNYLGHHFAPPPAASPPATPTLEQN